MSKPTKKEKICIQIIHEASRTYVRFSKKNSEHLTYLQRIWEQNKQPKNHKFQVYDSFNVYHTMKFLERLMCGHINDWYECEHWINANLKSPIVPMKKLCDLIDKWQEIVDEEKNK